MDACAFYKFLEVFELRYSRRVLLEKHRQSSFLNSNLYASYKQSPLTQALCLKFKIY